MRPDVITSEQIRAARALLGWSANDLAHAAGIGVATIRRFELMQGLPTGYARSVEAIQRALETAGIQFIGTPDDGPGVRLRPLVLRDEFWRNT